MSDLIRACDVSNYSGSIAAFLAAHPDIRHVVVRIPLPWERGGLDAIARQQVAEARAASRSVGGYFWTYGSRSPEDTVHAVIAWCASVNLILPRAWADVEPYSGANPDLPGVGWLLRMAAAFDGLETPCGLYTAGGIVDSYYDWDDFQRLKALPLWIGDWRDGQTWEALESWWSERGWRLFGWQHAADPDLDLFIPEAVAVPTPAPPVDPCAEIRQQLAAAQADNDRLRAAMKQAAALLTEAVGG